MSTVVDPNVKDARDEEFTNIPEEKKNESKYQYPGIPVTCDGAAAVVLTRESIASEKGHQPVAKIVGLAAHAREPKDFTVAPVGAIEKVLKNAGWAIDDVDLWEVNEAFACVAMFAMRDIGIAHDKINVNGGATALGHPIGASGTRIIVTLINALKTQGKKRGVASLCIGGGEATAIAVELA